MLLLSVLPTLTVFVLIVLIAKRAEEHIRWINSITPGDTEVKVSLRLHLAFGLVFLVGFGLESVVDLNSLLNLSGYVHIVPGWEQDDQFCKYYFLSNYFTNIITNFANTVILIHTKSIRAALAEIYRNSTQHARRVTRMLGGTRDNA